MTPPRAPAARTEPQHGKWAVRYARRGNGTHKTIPPHQPLRAQLLYLAGLVLAAGRLGPLLATKINVTRVGVILQVLLRVLSLPLYVFRYRAAFQYTVRDTVTV